MRAAFYRTKIDESQMVVSVNLDYVETVPVPGKAHCFELGLQAAPSTPREKRNELLNRLQYALIDELTESVGVLYAGRTNRPLQRNLYFYCTEDQLKTAAQVASTVIGRFQQEPLRTTLKHFDDGDWTVYSQILMPSEADDVRVAYAEDEIL